jgi:acyl carrier protein
MGEGNIINGKVREFIVTNFPLAAKLSVQDEESLMDRGIVDSLGILDIVQFLEREFSIEVTDDDLMPEHFSSIQGITSFTRQKIDGAR